MDQSKPPLIVSSSSHQTNSSQQTLVTQTIPFVKLNDIQKTSFEDSLQSSQMHSNLSTETIIIPQW